MKFLNKLTTGGNMKKIFLFLMCVLFAVTMVGCSSSDSKALKELDSQLSKTESLVSSTSTSEVSEVSPKICYDCTDTQINSLRNRAYNDMVLEEDLRQEILSLSAFLKDGQIKNKYKLSKKAAASLNELTDNLEKYTDCLSDTKNEIKTTVNGIKKYTSVGTVNSYQAISGYTTLANTMNERNAYMNNILVTLNEISNLLNDSIVIQEDAITDQNNTNNETSQNNTTQPSQIENPNTCNSNNNTSQNYQQNKTSGGNYDYQNQSSQPQNGQNYSNRIINQNLTDDNQNNTINNQATPKENKPRRPLLRKNIDSYNPYSKSYLEENNQIINNQNYNTNDRNNSYNSTITDNTNNANYNNTAGTTYGNRGSLKYNRINPNRNTDTFYPKYINIDTYRYYPNRYNNVIVSNNLDSQDHKASSTNKQAQIELSSENLSGTKDENAVDDNREDIETTQDRLDKDVLSGNNEFALHQFHKITNGKGKKIDQPGRKKTDDKFGHMKEIKIF